MDDPSGDTVVGSQQVTQYPLLSLSRDCNRPCLLVSQGGWGCLPTMVGNQVVIIVQSVFSVQLSTDDKQAWEILVDTRGNTVTMTVGVKDVDEVQWE